MMDNIRKAFREEVADLTWIDSETKPRLYQKVYFFIGLLLFLDCRAAMGTDTHTLSLRKQPSFLAPGPSGVSRHSGRERRRTAVFAGYHTLGKKKKHMYSYW